MSQTQMLGVSHIQRAKALLSKQDRKLVDYWWLYPPASARHVDVRGNVELPAETDSAAVLTYNVPSGMVFVLTHVVVQLSTTGLLSGLWTAGDGSIEWQLTVNPQNSPAAAPVRGFGNVVNPLGSFLFHPWPLEMPEIFNPLDVLQWSVTNVANSDFVGDQVACGLKGYTLEVAETADTGK